LGRFKKGIEAAAATVVAAPRLTVIALLVLRGWAGKNSTGSPIRKSVPPLRALPGNTKDYVFVDKTCLNIVFLRAN
jgi:hypothetical protein